MKYLESYFLFEKKVPKSERDNIFRSDKYILVSPLTHNASCKYGAFSNWCISVPGEDYLWDKGDKETRKTIVVILIQRNLKYNDDRENKIDRYKFLYDEVESGETITEDEMEEMKRLELSGENLDFRKIAFIYSKRNNRLEVWTNNNLDVTDLFYGDDIYNLPIDNIVIEHLFDYIEKNRSLN